jgi:hypothetical protein
MRKHSAFMIWREAKRRFWPLLLELPEVEDKVTWWEIPLYPSRSYLRDLRPFSKGGEFKNWSWDSVFLVSSAVELFTLLRINSVKYTFAKAKYFRRASAIRLRSRYLPFTGRSGVGFWRA